MLHISFFLLQVLFITEVRDARQIQSACLKIVQLLLRCHDKVHPSYLQLVVRILQSKSSQAYIVWPGIVSSAVQINLISQHLNKLATFSCGLFLSPCFALRDCCPCFSSVKDHPFRKAYLFSRKRITSL